MPTTAFREMKPFSQFMFAIFVMVASVLIFAVAATFIAIPFFGIDSLLSSVSPANGSSTENINFLKYFQVVQSVGLFVVPPFIIGYLYHGKISNYLFIDRTASWQAYVLSAVALLAALPFINFIGEINKQMQLPESLAGIENWMRNMEDAAELMVKKFMKVDTISGLLFNIFMIGMLPALGEELMFRGVFQRIFTAWTRNYHWGIWITAFLFSAMHMQFYGFIPRMVLGAMFGYLLVWTGTMWVPIVAHLVNNTMGVIGYFLINKGVITEDVEEIGVGSDQILLMIGSLIATGFLLLLIYQRDQFKLKMPVNQNDSQAPRID